MGDMSGGHGGGDGDGRDGSCGHGGGSGGATLGPKGALAPQKYLKK